MGEVEVWTVGAALRAARARSGMSLRIAARKADCSFSSLSMWERDDGVPSPDVLKGLADAYGRPEKLLNSVSAIRRRLVLPAERTWAAHPPRGGVWAWISGPVESVSIRWGPWRAGLDGPDDAALGVIVTCPIARPNPAVLVDLAVPGWCSVGQGGPPSWLDVPRLDCWDVLRVDDAPSPVVSAAARELHLRPDKADWLARKLRIPAAVFRALVPHAGDEKPPAQTVPICEEAAPAWPSATIARRARAVHGLSGRAAVAGANKIEGTSEHPLTLHQLRMLEDGARPGPTAPIARLDVLFEFDGRLVCGPITGATACGGADVLVHVPSFWRGPLWLRLEPLPQAQEEVTLEWGPYTKQLLVQGHAVVELRYAGDDSAGPLRVRAPGWIVTAGLGRHPSAVDINDAWDIHPGWLKREIFQAAADLASPALRAVSRLHR